MKITEISDVMNRAQDGAFFGNYFFRFNSKGLCNVFDISPLKGESKEPITLCEVAEFCVNPNEKIVPHFNSVVFGNEYFDDGDEFPVLYANVYNNYKNDKDRKEGTCCVYRILKDGANFSMALVQVLKIGFTEDKNLWKSGVDDVRPYGNFVIDVKQNALYAFTMRDETKTTRYFAFRLPKLNDGLLSEEYGVKTVVLDKNDIDYYFDTEYHNYIQGACCHNGFIYSAEGFNKDIPPAIRIISIKERKQIFCFNLLDYGYSEEAEFIDFIGDECYYGDFNGKLYRIDFEL